MLPRPRTIDQQSWTSSRSYLIVKWDGPNWWSVDGNRSMIAWVLLDKPRTALAFV
jgi:hypothetical protein